MTSPPLLQDLLQRLATSAAVPALSEKDVELLAASLVPTTSRSSRSLAFLCLSKICESAQKSDGTDADNAQVINSLFRPFIDTAFTTPTDDDVDPVSLVPSASLLAALFPLAPSAAAQLLTTPPDPLAILLEAGELPSPLQPALAELLAQAASTKAGRDIVRERAVEWLEGALEYEGENKDLSVHCAVALTKLHQDAGLPGQNGSSTAESDAAEVVLCSKMVQHVLSAPTSSSAVLSTLEGLSILSLRPRIKHLLAISPGFLTSILALAPVIQLRAGSLPITPRGSTDIDEKIFEPVETGVCYGVTVILVNLTSRKPLLSAEDQQIARLRAMAISGKKQDGAEVDDPFESDDAVRERVKLVLKAGVVPALRGLARAESRLVKIGLGRLCLNVIEDQADRPLFVRDGGFRVLTAVVRDLAASPVTKSSSTSAEADILPAAQAMAKLVITTRPSLLFPPPHITTSVNALSPMYTLLLSPSSTLLQQFEALMALTNLASIDPSLASRIVNATCIPEQTATMWRGTDADDKVKLMSKVEELMLDDNMMIRRAATELVCNLAASPVGFSHFSGEPIDSPGSTVTSSKVRSRLNVLLVLTSVDDLPTRLAASGALATVTDSTTACEAILSRSEEPSTSKRSAWTRVLEMLDSEGGGAEVDDDDEPIPVISSTPPNPALVHRAVIILFNLIQYVVALAPGARRDRLAAARKAGVEEKLRELLRIEMTQEVVEPVVECLKLLKELPPL